MSGEPLLCKSQLSTGNKGICNKKAKYIVTGLGYLCGTHLPKDLRKDKEKYLINRETVPRQSAAAAIAVPDDTVIIDDIDDTGSNVYTALSNLAETPFTLKGVIWRSAENAIHGLSVLTGDIPSSQVSTVKKIVKRLASLSPLKAREYASTVGHVRKDWENRGPEVFEIRDRFMFEIVRQKIMAYESLKKLLVSTGNKKIIVKSVEPTHWTIGQNKGGDNMLGRVLTMVREELDMSNVYE